MTNKYAGKCVACGQVVAAGEGEIQSVVGQNKRWVVRHLAACPPQADDDDDDDDDGDDGANDGPPPPFATALERAAWTQFAFAFARVAGSYEDALGASDVAARVLPAIQAAFNMLDEGSQGMLTRPACAARLAQLLTRLGTGSMKQVSADLLMEVCF